MATPPSASAQALPAESFFRAALFFLVLTAVLTLVSTGKLDLFTTVLAPLAVLYKGFRWWRGDGPELQQGTATRMVIVFLVLFPLDALFISRNLVAGTVNVGLYAELMLAIV